MEVLHEWRKGRKESRHREDPKKPAQLSTGNQPVQEDGDLESKALASLGSVTLGVPAFQVADLLAISLRK